MPDVPYILLPPSESKTAGGAEGLQIGSFDAALRVPRRELRVALRAYLHSAPRDRLEATLGVRGPLLDRATVSMGAILRGRAPLLPSWQRFDGVVWSRLDPATLTPEQRNRILVPSGLYGVTSGEDPIGDFRLRMNVSVAPLGSLSRYWRPHLTRVIAKRVEGSVVVNLLPKEHAASLDLGAVARHCRLVTVSFVDVAAKRAVGHEAKAVKGVVARAVLEGGADALDSFDWRGWRAERDGDEARILAP